MNISIRLQAMQGLADFLGASAAGGEENSGLYMDDNVRQLLCGFAVQLLDTRYLGQIQANAVELAPQIFSDLLLNANIDVVMEHCDDILGNLFKILDNPRCQVNHAKAVAAINTIVDDIIATGNISSLSLSLHFLWLCLSIPVSLPLICVTHTHNSDIDKDTVTLTHSHTHTNTQRPFLHSRDS